MKFKDTVMLFLALGCGFLGGSAAVRLQSVAAQNNDVLRVTRLELVDGSGGTRAILGMDSYGRKASLSFLTGNGKTVASFGVSSTMPFIELFGDDGRIRAALKLNTLGQPYLALGDEAWEGRVLLGAMEGGDILPADKAQTVWVLQFTDLGHVKAIIGMNQTGAGTLAIYNPKRTFRVPPE